MNLDIMEPAGPIDPEVGVVGAWRPNGSLIGCLLNFACHGTCRSGDMTHGDWFFHVEETVRGTLGNDVGVVTLNGAAGDLTQVDNRSASRDFGDDICHILGLRVGTAAIQALLAADPRDDSELACADERVTVSRRAPTSASVEAAWALMDDPSADPDAVLFARERILADWLARRSPEVVLRLGALRLGDAALLSNPAEPFCSLGLAMKRASPFRPTLIASFANGRAGYIPDGGAFAADGGGYETRLTSYSNLAPDAGETLVRKTLDLVASLPPPVPAPSEAPAPGRPWMYGACPPEVD